MGFRHLYIANRATLFIRHRQLCIQQEEMTTVPVDDLASIMLESPACTITSAALGILAEGGVAVYTCDQKHLPNGVLMPFHAHSRQLRAFSRQISASKPFQKQLWRIIIQQKIINQSLCLDLCSKEGGERLMTLASGVTSGDRENAESRAAQIYFISLFGKGFGRRQDCPQNAALNYGYAILRGALARSLSQYGFIPCVGLFHHGELNAFNLADDLLEPFRPMVDQWVVRFGPTQSHEFNPHHKRSLYSLFYARVEQDGQTVLMTTALERMVVSLVTAYETQNPEAIKCPTLLPIMEEPRG